MSEQQIMSINDYQTPDRLNDSLDIVGKTFRLFGSRGEIVEWTALEDSIVDDKRVVTLERREPTDQAGSDDLSTSGAESIIRDYADLVAENIAINEAEQQRQRYMALNRGMGATAIGAAW